MANEPSIREIVNSHHREHLRRIAAVDRRIMIQFAKDMAVMAIVAFTIGLSCAGFYAASVSEPVIQACKGEC